jgi:ubiquinone/menaquinone biosynthesis C-methylase UbiE
MLASAPITDEHFRRLHPIVIEAREQILVLLSQLHRERRVLRRAINRKMDPETAVLEHVDGDALVLRTEHFELDDRAYVFLNFELDGVQYFFSARRLDDKNSQRLRVRVPSAIYRAERRGRTRRSLESAPRKSRQLHVMTETAGAIEAEIEDSSPAGLAICLRENSSQLLKNDFPIRFVDGDRPGSHAYARVRHRSHLPERPGWMRIGLDLSPRVSKTPIEIEHRETILEEGSWQRRRLGWKIMQQGVRLASRRATQALLRRNRRSAEINVVRYANGQGEPIVAIVDSWGDTRRAPAVVIPPAWGRTKETLLPLSQTIVAAFAAARQPVVVVRFDGIRKRGESYNDPDCREPGAEHRRFCCSQGVRDIQATLDFLESSPEFRPESTILVTFSAAALEGRKSVSIEGGKRLHGWVSVVGSPDLQSMMRVISGGVDYVAGVERGVRFGIQEVLGVFVDIDHTGLDAIANGLAFVDDARRDLAATEVPITWFAGAYDAWMELDRVSDILSHGKVDNRRLVVIPTGHQLRTSRQAVEVFQSIAREIGRMTVGDDLPSTLPDFVAMEERRELERRRLSLPAVDLRGFWHDYLVGRDGSIGIELQVNTSYYRSFMAEQIEALCLGSGDRVADLGSGTGAFVLQLAEERNLHSPVVVHEFDFVREGLERARKRINDSPPTNGLSVCYVESTLDVRRGCLSVPARAESYDAVLASLLLGYVSDPVELLREMRRILRPGGRLVLSNMRRDGDISNIFQEGLTELRQGLGRERLGDEGSEVLDAAARNLLNEGARLLELEESGAFRFWDPDELARMVRRAGFRKVKTTLSYGVPPQIVVVSAERG